MFSIETCTDVDSGSLKAQNADMMLDERILYDRIGEALRKHRERAGLSQARLAEAAGLRRTSLVNAEAGRQRLPLHSLYALCAELGIEVAEVLPSLTDVRTLQDKKEGEIIVGGKVRYVPPMTAGLVRAVLDEFDATDKGAA